MQRRGFKIGTLFSPIKQRLSVYCVKGAYTLNIIFD